jgi:hypothetical protein
VSNLGLQGRFKARRLQVDLCHLCLAFRVGASITKSAVREAVAAWGGFGTNLMIPPY